MQLLPHHQARPQVPGAAKILCLLANAIALPARLGRLLAPKLAGDAAASAPPKLARSPAPGSAAAGSPGSQKPLLPCSDSAGVTLPAGSAPVLLALLLPLLLFALSSLPSSGRKSLT